MVRKPGGLHGQKPVGILEVTRRILAGNALNVDENVP